MSEISLKCEIWHLIAKIWGRTKFRIFGRNFCHYCSLRSIFPKNVGMLKKMHFSKLTEIHWFFIFSFKIDFKRCLLHESLDFDNRNMDNFRQKKLSWFLSHPMFTPQMWWKLFPCWKQQCCFFGVPGVCTYHILVSGCQRTSHDDICSIRDQLDISGEN